MQLEEIPFYTIMPEVRNRVTELILASSKTAEFLGVDGYGLESIYDLYGTKYEDIVLALIKSYSGESWGLHGKIFLFNLTEELRRHISDEGLTCMFSDGENTRLENLTLYDGEKIIFSCLSHEVFCLGGMADIDDSLKKSLLSAVKQVIESSILYSEMSVINKNLKDKTEKQFAEDILILRDLHCYVDMAKKAWFHQTPNVPCTYKEYKQLAHRYFTDATFSAFEKVDSFEALQPLPVAHTAEDVLSSVYKDTPQFLNTELYNRIKKELSILEYIKKQ